jgi:branched-chain amino acid aminotransferase
MVDAHAGNDLRDGGAERMNDDYFGQRDGRIWYNGTLVSWEDATVHVLTPGLEYASGVFEGIRAYAGHPFKLTEHNQRLHRSAEILDMTLPYDVPTLDDACREVLRVNGLGDCYIRPVAFRGSGGLRIGAQDNEINVAIAAWPWRAHYSTESLTGGISLKSVRWARPAPNTAPTQSKAFGSYMIATLAKREAMNAGFTDALMMDFRGLVAESSGANLFMVKDGALRTPVADCFLDGITRQAVLSLAADARVEAKEARITYDDLLLADEVFLTGTAAEVTPVRRIDETEFRSGPVTKTLMTAFAELTLRGQRAPR